VILAAGNNALFGKLCAALQRPELCEDSQFIDNASRNAHIDELQTELEASLTAHPTAHWMTVFAEAGVPCSPINNVADVLADPHVAARNMIVSAADATAGTIRMAGNPIKLSAFDDPAERPPAPDLDAHRAKVLGNRQG
jgi:CoA:oxalate CoA-transferase